MKLKRNDPCHCGSGKKYKYCHMKADLEAEKAADSIQPPIRPAIETPPTLGGKPIVDVSKEIDPEVERLNQLYEEFNDADYREKRTILRSAIEEKKLDSELAFEFFNDLYSQMAEQGDRKEFAELAALLQTHQPEVYAKENHWFWSWEVTNALALADDTALQQAVDQLIENGGQDLDQFFPVFHCLLYHDRRENLRNALNKHQPRIVAEKYFGNVEDELSQKFVDLLVLDYLETQPQSELLNEQNIEKLCTNLAPYSKEILRDGLVTFLSLAGGLSSREWSMTDFQFAMRTKRSSRSGNDNNEEEHQDPAVVHLRDLCAEFLYYAHHVENIPFTKADMARGHLVNYILERQRGELIDEEPKTKFGRKNRLQKPDATINPINHLLPDHQTIDRFLMRFYGFMANGTYEGAAFFELIPTWTRFLQVKGLVSVEEGQRSLRSMQDLSQSMLKLMEQYDSDPTLALNMGKWREQAGI